jgi:restriction endonuclease S subunit
LCGVALNSAFGVVPESLDNYESTADLPAFDCNGVRPYFMFYRAIQPSFYLTNGMIADGSRKAKRIHAETFLNMPLELPSIDEQNRIARFFLDLDHLITLHQRKYIH